MGLTVTFDQARYKDSIRRLIEDLGANGDLLMREEARLLSRDLIEATPPKTKSQGNKAVARDLKRVFVAITTVIKYLKAVGKKNVAREVARLVKLRDYTRAIAFLAQRSAKTTERVPVKSHTRSGVSVKSYTQVRTRDGSAYPNVGQGTTFAQQPSASIHEGRRNAYGHVTAKTISQIILNPRALRAYIDRVQSHVGFAKAGWLPAAVKYGANVPSWIRRFSGSAPGYVVERLGPAVTGKEITLANRGSKMPRYQEQVNFAVQRRYKSMISEAQRLLRGGKTRRASFAETPSGQPN